MDTATRDQILDESFCISHSANTFGKGMNPTPLTRGMGKIFGKTGPFSPGMATALGKGKIKNQTC